VVRTLAGSDLLPAIYFMFSRRAVEEAAESCRRLSLLPVHRAVELRRLARKRLADLPAEDRDLPQVERLLDLLPKGIGFHHAGLLPPLKTLVEELLASGRLKVVFATDTLALGLNVPARSVVVGEMTKFDGQTRRALLPGEYRQLTGRAGRRGMDLVGYSIILPSPWVALDRAVEIATGEVAPLESAFRPGYGTLLNLQHRAGGEDRLARLIAGSLRQFQDGGRIRSLTREQEELAAAMASLPAGCLLDGGPVNWLEEDRALHREQERSEAALEAAKRQSSALQERLSAWPWRYSKQQKKGWLSAARHGEMAYSRRWGWLVYLGPSSQGIGLFLAGRNVVPVSGYGELDYLPDPPIHLDLPEDVIRRASQQNGAADQLERHELERFATAVEHLSLPDVEAEAREIIRRAQAANAATIKSLEEWVSAAHDRLRSASQDLARSPCRSCHLRAEHRRSERQRRSFGGLLAAVERELQEARSEARLRAHWAIKSLRSVLESFGYLDSGRPTTKAKGLQRIFDANALVIAELLDWGVLADASAAEVAEVASWFAFDRGGSGRALATTERLARMRAAAEQVAKQVVEVERRFGVNLSTPLAPDFGGVALAWATGATLSDLCSRSGLAEGDIVFTLQKTIDICRQLAQAAAYCRTPSVARRAGEAERLLRRGVVDSYYRWIVGGASIPTPNREPAGAGSGAQCAHRPTGESPSE
jgi:ATP-dependent RNA helicase HelY